MATVRGSSLREIEDDLLALADLLTEVGGDVSDREAEEAIDKWLNETQQALKHKLDGYITLIHTLKGRAALRKVEAQRLTDLARLDEAVVTRLENALRSFMERHGHTEIQTDYHRIRLANVGGVLPLEITGEVPADYRRTVVTEEIDRERIRQELESGAELPFARLRDRGKRVNIK